VRKEVQENNAAANAQAKPNFAYGYGGKYGVQEDRQDKVCPVLTCTFPPYMCSWFLCIKSSWNPSLLLSNTRPNTGDLLLYPCGSGLVAPGCTFLASILTHPSPSTRDVCRPLSGMNTRLPPPSIAHRLTRSVALAASLACKISRLASHLATFCSRGYCSNIASCGIP